MLCRLATHRQGWSGSISPRATNADLVNCRFPYLHRSGFVVLGGIECEDLGNHVQDGRLHEQLGDREGLLGVFLILRGVREEAPDGGQEDELLD